MPEEIFNREGTKIERPKFLTDLLAEVDSFDESLFPCNYKREEGEPVLGMVSPWVRKLYSIQRYYHRQMKLTAVDREYTNPSECAGDCDLCELKYKYGILNEMMWTLIRAESNLWSEPSVGIRENWQVVRSQPDDDEDGFKKFILGMMRGK